MKKTFFALGIAAIGLLSMNAVMVEKDPLHGKIYEVQATEFKDGAPKTSGKPLVDEILFKGGKLYSDLAASDKLGKFDAMIKYDI
jgi:hypothetical protein